MTVLFGGAQRFDDRMDDQTWVWDGTVWTQVSENGPSERYNAEAVYDSVGDRILLYGGQRGSINFLDDLWEWDGAAWRMRDLQGPGARTHHAMTYDEARRAVVLFGGDNGNPNDQTWEYRLCSERERVDSALCRERRSSRVVVVKLKGGIGGDAYTVTLLDGTEVGGKVDARGRARVRFEDRPPGETGTATATWGCGAADSATYTCR